MNHEQKILIAATLLLAMGLGLMLPRGDRRGWRLGLVLGLVSLGLFGSQVPYLGGLGQHSLFLALAGVTVVSAVATVTFRNPVYSAIWFGLSLLGTASLFLCQGAQFLGVATVVVYAGAILVTFLFVLMLANPAGQAYYDRLSWEAWLSAGAGAVMIGVLTVTFSGSLRGLQDDKLFDARNPKTLARDANILSDEHMAHLGKELFSRHLIAVEVAGTLLLVALVGAVAIVGQRVQGRVQGSGGTAPGLVRVQEVVDRPALSPTDLQTARSSIHNQSLEP